ncbi:MAG: transglutaminase-like domain-containing protein [Planctomycetota bacterium]
MSSGDGLEVRARGGPPPGSDGGRVSFAVSLTSTASVALGAVGVLAWLGDNVNGPERGASLLALVTLAVGARAIKLRRRDEVALLALGLGPLGVLMGAWHSERPALMSLLPVAAIVSVIGLTFVNSRASRRRAARSTGATPVTRRVLTGFGLACALAALGLVTLACFDVARAAIPSMRADASPRQVTAAQRDDSRPSAGSRDRAATTLFAETSLGFTRSDAASLVSNADVVRVRSVSPPVTDSVLYLRHMVLDRIGPEGLSSSERRVPAARRDGDDGARDGWVQLSSASAGTRPGAPTTVRTYLIEARPLRIEDRPWTLMPLPQPALAVTLEPVRYSPDGPSLLVGSPTEWLEYKCQAAPSAWTRRELGRQHTTRTPRALQLPPDSRELRALGALARRITRDVDSDLDKVLAVMDHLRAYDYSLERTEFGGVAALLELTRRRRGYCTQFASAATLMLRLVDVPARVAVGSLARATEDGGWVARERDTHAWIEVPFDEAGWLTFDPTPSQGRAGGSSQGWSPLVDEPPDPGSDRSAFARFAQALQAAFLQWRDGGVELSQALLEPLGAALLGPVGGSLAVLFAGVMGGVWWRRRAGRRAAEAPLEAGRRAARRGRKTADDLFARLDAVLAATGRVRPASRTLAAHAQALVTAGRAPKLLPEFVRAAYRERFGPGLKTTQLAAVEEFMLDLAREPRDGNIR